jgi:hypothetical protein
MPRLTRDRAAQRLDSSAMHGNEPGLSTMPGRMLKSRFRAR